MRRTVTPLIALFLTLTLASCAQFERTLEGAGLAYFGGGASHAQVVTIVAEGTMGGEPTRGRGAAIGERRILTVEHVVGTSDQVMVNVSEYGKHMLTGVVVERFAARPEPLVVIQLLPDECLFFAFDGFAPEDRFTAASEFGLRHVITARGYAPWSGAALQPGDSGSPVINERGELVALLTGRIGSTAVGPRVDATVLNLALGGTPATPTVSP
jgi:hypothetical protein